MGLLRWCSLLSLFALLPTERLSAQSYRYELGLSLQSSYYQGDLGRRGLIAPQSLSFALELKRNLSLRWALTSELALRRLRGDIAYAATDLPGTITTRHFARDLGELSAGGEYHFFPYSDSERYLGTRPWTPFLGAGLGLAGGSSSGELQLVPNAFLRLGIKWRLHPRWALQGSWTLRHTFTDQLEGLGPTGEQLQNPLRLTQATGWKSHDSYGVWSIGLTYSFSPRVKYPCE